MPPKTERFELRLEANTLERIDAWAESQSDKPTRSDAIRRLVEQGLSVRISDGERLLIMMMRDLNKSLKVKGEIDADYVADAISGGHYWGLEWQYSGIFHSHTDSASEVRAVVDILDMASFMEEAYEALTESEKSYLEKELGPLGNRVIFRGFNGNNENERLGIARHMIDQLGRFQRFKGRELNSHMPTTDMYQRMLDVFLNIRNNIDGRPMSVEELIKIQKARIYPSSREKIV